MADVQVPHLKMPLNFTHGPAPLVEQDSLEEVAQCAETVLATPQGYRDELPTFGTPDQTFSVGGIEPRLLMDALERWEPRAVVAIETDDILLEELVMFARVDLMGEEGGE